MGEKHTPAPWTVRPARQDDRLDVMGCDTIDGPGWLSFCLVATSLDGEPKESEEGRANARLIAAAPDLLAMLKVAQLWLDVDGRFDMQGINAAIAKATGIHHPTTGEGQDKTQHASTSPGPVNCSIRKRFQNEVTPRTCERCLLGPCPFFHEDGAKKL